MSAPRFYISNGLPPVGEAFAFPAREAHHAVSVLRLAPGDAVELRDGRGGAFSGTVEEAGRSGVLVRVTGRGAEGLGESPCEVTLALALARQDRMDLAARQAVELGAAGIVAFRAARSQYGLSGAAAEKRRERFLAIAREALCQCGRSRLPEVAVIPGFPGFLAWAREWAAVGEGLLVVALEGPGGAGLLGLFRAHPGARRVLAAVGPEGGWTQIEAAALRDAGFLAVTLGPRVLRYETAAAVLLSSVQMLWGDAGGEERC